MSVPSPEEQKIRKQIIHTLNSLFAVESYPHNEALYSLISEPKISGQIPILSLLSLESVRSIATQLGLEVENTENGKNSLQYHLLAVNNGANYQIISKSTESNNKAAQKIKTRDAKNTFIHVTDKVQRKLIYELRQKLNLYFVNWTENIDNIHQLVFDSKNKKEQTILDTEWDKICSLKEYRYLLLLESLKKEAMNSKICEVLHNKEGEATHIRRLWISEECKTELKENLEKYLCNFDFEADGGHLQMGDLLATITDEKTTLSWLYSKWKCEIGKYSWAYIVYDCIQYLHCIDFVYPLDSSLSFAPSNDNCEQKEDNEAKPTNESLLFSDAYIQRIVLKPRKVWDAESLKQKFAREWIFQCAKDGVENNITMASLQPWRNSSLDKYSFSVLSYNTLARSLCDEEIFPWTKSHNLSWKHRSHQLLDKISKDFDVDILCLQEIDETEYAHFWKPHLTKLFHCKDQETLFYVHKSGSYGGANKKLLVQTQAIIGNLIVINCKQAKKFVWIKNIEIPLLRLVDFCSNEPSKKRYGLPQVAQLMILFHPLSSSYLCIVNAHVSASFKTPDVQIMQTVSIIFCGDFNSTPRSAVYQLIREKQLPSDIWQFKQIPSEVQLPLIDTSHDLHLQSSFESVLGREMQFTNFVRDADSMRGRTDPKNIRAMCLDYIWHTTNEVICIGALDELKPEVAELELALPNSCEPSDHICIGAVFSWKKYQSEVDQQLQNFTIKSSATNTTLQILDDLILWLQQKTICNQYQKNI
ncbi:hypothetical protein RFI_35895 [Reticulomyxa filosa]|uniref:Endonuclease/exonuclease/phosphatase domain-containing protein n=1 Tax=Reticulomyxa filosa TaxID=46433 RepID=X6LJK3_RETFI|nr:hypothetical protein RFI_35895 [Reticulomyxa filosa]|eukprot:ETO01546.1 hypothetical protein RFI_35895 [Reticulomyxa filosa]